MPIAQSITVSCSLCISSKSFKIEQGQEITKLMQQPDVLSFIQITVHRSHGTLGRVEICSECLKKIKTEQTVIDARNDNPPNDERTTHSS